MTWLSDSLGMGLFIGLAIPVGLLLVLGVACVVEAAKVWWEFTRK